MLVIKEMRKLDHQKKNLLEQGREPTTNLTHLWRRRRDLNPCHIEEFMLIVASWVIRAKMVGNSKICIGIQSPLILPEFIYLMLSLRKE